VELVYLAPKYYISEERLPFHRMNHNKPRAFPGRCNIHPHPVDTWLSMMLVVIKSEVGLLQLDP